MFQKFLQMQKKKLDKDISKKKEQFDTVFEKELKKAENEILSLKKQSPESIKNIAEEISSKIIENMTGEKLNSSSIKASVDEISKNKMNKYL